MSEICGLTNIGFCGLFCGFHIWCVEMLRRNSARFLWKSIPPAIKDSQPELVAAWKIGQKLWVRDYGGVHEAIRGFDWSQQVQDLVAAFSGRVLSSDSLCKDIFGCFS